ncbi:MAG: hypothetical protein H0T73_01175 [Ardenticatenales bacterium]|nr:hypothetical protein [Ardenticatenales bacterium]
MGISSELLQRIRDELLRCAPFDSPGSVRALFVDRRIAPWRNVVPDAGNAASRVNLLIEELHEQENERGENALVLILRVFSDQASVGTACRGTLAGLADELARELGGGMASASQTGRIPLPGQGSSLGARRTLSLVEKQLVVTALLACDTIKDHEQRRAMLAELPREMATAIPANNVDRVHVLNIVNTWLQYANGFPQLLETLRAFEGDKLPMQEVEAMVRQLGIG